MALTIGQAARATGMATKTIRYYEEVGVLPPPGRTVAGYRQYSEQGVQQLRFIRRARILGLSLQHLKTLRPALNGGFRAALRPRLLELVHAHLATVRQQINELGLLQNQLAQVRRRLLAPAPRRPGGVCRCLGPVDSPVHPARSKVGPPRRPSAVTHR